MLALENGAMDKSSCSFCWGAEFVRQHPCLAGHCHLSPSAPKGSKPLSSEGSAPMCTYKYTQLKIKTHISRSNQVLMQTHTGAGIHDRCKTCGGHEKGGMRKKLSSETSELQFSRISGWTNTKSVHFQAMSSSLFTLLGQVLKKKAISTVLTDP